MNVPGGLDFDKITLVDTIVSSDTVSTPNSLLPYPGQPPEFAFPGNIGYIRVAAAPEPSTWAMMILGVGLAGAQLRSRKRAALQVIAA